MNSVPPASRGQNNILLKSAFRGAPIYWSSTASEQDERQFLKLTHDHRIQPLLYYHLQRTGSLERWPDRITSALAHASRITALAEVLVQTELPKVLSALARVGVQPLLMKGTPLSYTHYPAPHLRPHEDIDLLIQKQDVEAIERAMQKLGYQHYCETRGELVSHQMLYRKKHNSAVSFDFDFHWKICNPQMLADLISYDELEKTAICVPELGEHARALSAPAALFLACVHRVAHHHGMPRLIWLYDIHLLVGKMSRAELDEFAALAASKQVKRICLEGLKLAQEWFGSNLPADLVHALQGSDSEPSRRFLAGNLRRVDLLRMDLSQLNGTSKLRLLYEHLFPSAEYMLHRYAVSSRLLLPVLYLHRAATGMRRWFRNGAQASSLR